MDTAARISTAQERSSDWEGLIGLLALTLAHCWLAGTSADGKLLKAATRLHVKVPGAESIESNQSSFSKQLTK